MLGARDLKPRLFANAEGDLLLEISVKGLKEVRKLPSMDTLEEAEQYINRVVLEMAKDLYRKLRNKRKTQRKKLK